jgi:hypothetical protein
MTGKNNDPETFNGRLLRQISTNSSKGLWKKPSTTLYHLGSLIDKWLKIGIARRPLVENFNIELNTSANSFTDCNKNSIGTFCKLGSIVNKCGRKSEFTNRFV